MAYKYIQIVKEDRITILTIDRPEVLNALHLPACQELDEAFNDFSEDPNSWVAIITGAGDRAFSSGNDLKWQAKYGEDVLQKGLDSLRGAFGGIVKRFDCFKPIIAAVNGFALGGGFEVVLACDIVVAADHANFGLPEPRVGMMADGGGVIRLPRQISYHLAMNLILTGRQISAQEGYRLGIVNEVVPLEKLMRTAKKWATEISDCAPLAVRASKEAALKGLNMPLDEAINKVYPGMVFMKRSEDFIEGPRAFVEKRKPIWKGK